MSSSIIIDIKSNACESNVEEFEKPKKEKKKKLNKGKLLKYLLQKAYMINSKEEFLQLLDKTEASLLEA